MLSEFEWPGWRQAIGRLGVCYFVAVSADLTLLSLDLVNQQPSRLLALAALAGWTGPKAMAWIGKKFKLDGYDE